MGERDGYLNTVIVSQETPVRARFGHEESRCRRDSDGSLAIDLALPLLGGTADEAILPPTGQAAEAVDAGVFECVRSGGWMAGAAVVPLDPRAVEDTAESVYRNLLEATRGHSLYRIWNYVPSINEETGGLENYRAFNIGRASAFRAAGIGQLPAASAVGTGGRSLCVVFLAGTEEARFFENPEQVPAYRYPAAYGPQSPSFSRGVSVGQSGQSFLSGTASILGHESVGAGDLARQLAVTGRHVRRMMEAMAVGSRAYFKCYLRHGRRDLAPARAALGALWPPGASVTYVEADICRSELLVEVEGGFA